MKRFNSQAKIGDILKNFIDTFFSIWKEYQMKFKKLEKVPEIKFNMQPIFTQISEFMIENDLYESARIV